MVACGNGNTRAREDAATAEVKGGVVSSSVRWAFFSLRSVLLFYFRYVLSIRLLACLLVRACVRESELVGGALHTIRFGFLAALELWVAKNNHSLSLSLFFSFCLSLFLFAADVCYLFFLLL